MSHTKTVPRLATDPLKADHRHFAQVFKEFAKLGEWDVEKKVELFRSLTDRLAVHASIEEEEFYPALLNSVPPSDRPAILEAHEEHRIVRRLLEELAELGPEDAAFDAKMTVLGEQVAQHTREVERDLFPLFNVLPEDHRKSLIRRLARREEEWGVGLDV
jgi:hypothetical protein